MLLFVFVLGVILGGSVRKNEREAGSDSAVDYGCDCHSCIIERC